MGVAINETGNYIISFQVILFYYRWQLRFFQVDFFYYAVSDLDCPDFFLRLAKIKEMRIIQQNRFHPGATRLQ